MTGWKQNCEQIYKLVQNANKTCSIYRMHIFFRNGYKWNLTLFLSVCALQLAMRGPSGPMGLTGRSGPVVSLLFCLFLWLFVGIWLTFLISSLFTFILSYQTYIKLKFTVTHIFGIQHWWQFCIIKEKSSFRTNVLAETLFRNVASAVGGSVATLPVC